MEELFVFLLELLDRFLQRVEELAFALAAALGMLAIAFTVARRKKIRKSVKDSMNPDHCSTIAERDLPSNIFLIIGIHGLGFSVRNGALAGLLGWRGGGKDGGRSYSGWGHNSLFPFCEDGVGNFARDHGSEFWRRTDGGRGGQWRRCRWGDSTRNLEELISGDGWGLRRKWALEKIPSKDLIEISGSIELLGNVAAEIVQVFLEAVHGIVLVGDGDGHHLDGEDL